MPLLTDGPHDQPERLRAMRAGIAWSYDLLSSDEQRLFRRLAVFAGAFTLTAVEAVSPGHGSGVLRSVAGLVDKSLLQQATSNDEPRFVMLETIREYALERLEASGEETDARRAHAAYYLRLAEEAGAGLRGAQQQTVAGRGWRPTWTICGPRWPGPECVRRSGGRRQRAAPRRRALVLLVPAGSDR